MPRITLEDLPVRGRTSRPAADAPRTPQNRQCCDSALATRLEKVERPRQGDRRRLCQEVESSGTPGPALGQEDPRSHREGQTAPHPYWLGARRVHARPFAEWLVESGRAKRLGRLSEATTRQIWDWRDDGGTATFRVVDRLMCSLGELPVDVPDRLWILPSAGAAGAA